MKIRSYSELRGIRGLLNRFEYLRLGGEVGKATFGFDRYLNQVFYKSREWQDARRLVVLRDNGCDLGVEGYPISCGLIVHHMNPISVDDIVERRNAIFDPEFLVCVSGRTHNAIHYGDAELLPHEPIVRSSGDTCPWR